MDAMRHTTRNDYGQECLSPPDWRWATACLFHGRTQRRRMRSDDLNWLPTLVSLAEEVYPSKRRRRRPRISVPPELRRAFELYQTWGPLRWDVEARILAGQSDEEVAAATAVPVTVVVAYEHAFFDVRHRLEACDYILGAVVGHSPFRCFDEGDLKGLWGYYGYAAGPRILELVMSVSLGRSLPDWALREAPNATDAQLLELGVKAMLMASTGALTPGKLRKLKVLRAQMDELKQKAPSKELKDLVQASLLEAPELFADCDGQAAQPSDGAGIGVSEAQRPSTPAFAVVA